MAEYIDREAAIAYAISGRVRTLPTTENGENWIRQEEVRESLKAVPAADVAPVKRGKFTRHVLKNANVPWGFDCSACGAWFVIGEDTAEKYKYCPNCGARMDGDNEPNE